MSHQALIKCLTANHEVVIYALDATELVQESMERIGSFPPATRHLGQAMMASVLLQALSDSETNETLALQWNCDGPFGQCFAESRNYGEVRGTIQNPQAPVFDYKTGLGNGLLQVRRSRGPISTNSVVNAIGDVSYDLVEFLEQSEQKNCGINLSVQLDWDPNDPSKPRVKEALGYLVHVLPQPSEAKLNEVLVRWNSQMEVLGPISQWALREGQKNVDMVRMLSGEQDPQIGMTQRVMFSCSCSAERAIRALALLETEEAKDGISHADEPTEIRCEFCGRVYNLEPGAIQAWIKAHAGTEEPKGKGKKS